MNVLDLRLQRNAAIGDFDGVRIFVDGQDLASRFEEIGQPYDGLPPDSWRHLPDPRGDGRAAILACSCGDIGCGSLTARIDVQEKVVIWHDFYPPYGSDPGHREDLRFVFDRVQYEAAILAVVPADA